MRLRRLCSASLCLAAVLSAPALATTHVYFQADGNCNTVPGAGSPTTATVSPNGTILLNACVSTNSSAPFNGWQIIIDYTGATPAGLSYLDIPPTGGAGNSSVVNTADADFPFTGGAQPITYSEVPGGADPRFGIIYGLPFSTGQDISDSGGNYMAEFQLSSNGTCGDFTLTYQLAPDAAPNTQVFDPFGGNFDSGAVEFHSMILTVGQPNDDCANGIPVTGNSVCVPFDTTCATEDGVPHPASGCDYGIGDLGRIAQDLWYNYTASCTGTLTISTCDVSSPPTQNGNDTRIAVYAPGSSCVPTDGNLIGCNDDVAPGGTACGFESSVDVAVTSGQVYRVRTGTFPGGPFDIQDTLCFACVSACTPGSSQAQLAIDCGLAGNDPDCTLLGCDAVLGCTYAARPSGTACNDENVCTQTDQCNGTLSGTSCVGSNINTCNDFNTCTIDSCNPGAPGNGCLNDNVDDNLCTTDAECQAGGNVNASCDLAGDGTCDCLSGNNLNDGGTLCIDVRNCIAPQGAAPCSSNDSECNGPSPDGVFQCSDSNGNPLDGGVCVDQCCLNASGQVIVDIELGSTVVPACGAQLFLSYDNDALDFKGPADLNPDGELANWTYTFINTANEAAGTIDIVLGTPPGMACNPANGSFGGGTIARLTFNAIGDCKTGGVDFRPHNPPTAVGGPAGRIDIVGCNGETTPSGTDQISLSSPPVWTCPGSQTLNPDCETGTVTANIGAISVSDSCGTPPAISTLCEVTQQAVCGGDLDCGIGSACINGLQCSSGSCLPIDPTDPNSPRFCSVASCTNGLCPAAAGDPDVLGGGSVTFPQGVTTVVCSYTNDCGQSASCSFSIENTGTPALDIEVEMSPTMIAGSAADPIKRCIKFNLSKCEDTAEETYSFNAYIQFGHPGNLPGHGKTSVKVPKGNWTCLTARDPKHSLNATCMVECDDGRLHAAFKGSPAANPVCHWLIQGNLDYSDNGVNDQGDNEIDIIDYAILAGQYLTYQGRLTPCGLAGFHADLNGDGYVTLADFQFIILNFFELSKNKCVEVCNPSAELPIPNPRSSVTIRELVAAGLGQYAATADVNRDGVVNFADMTLFVQNHANDEPAIANDLLGAIGNRASEAGLR